MSIIKKQFCLIFVLNALVINHVVAMDESSSSSSSYTPGHRRSNSASSGPSNSSPKVKVVITNLDSPQKENLSSSKEKSPVGSLNDIDGEIPLLSPLKRTPSSPRITLTPAESATSDHFFKDSKLYVTVSPNIQIPLGGKGHNSTWSESLSSPEHWMPVITGVVHGIAMSLTKGIIEGVVTYYTQDTEILTLKKQIILLDHVNTKNSLEANQQKLEINQKALDAKKNCLAKTQTIVDTLISKMENGEELSNREQKILETNLSIIQQLSYIAE